MSGYGRTERRIAAALGPMPGAKAFAKRSWAALNFALRGERGFQYELADGVRLERAEGGVTAADARFFGYFDHSPFSAVGDRMLVHRRAGEACEVELLLLEGEAKGEGDCGRDREVRVLGRSRAFSAQQGALLRWRKGSAAAECIYNDYEDGVLGSRWIDVDTGDSRFLPAPIAAQAEDGARFVTLDFRGLADVAPDYAYPSDAQLPPSGLGFIDADGSALARVDLDRVRAFEPAADAIEARHELNHPSFAPDGESFVFVHRWFGPLGRRSRLLRYIPAHDALYAVLDGGMVSHFAWRADGALIAFARHEDRDCYLLLEPDAHVPRILMPNVLDRFGDGHPSLSPDGRWLLTDSYPDRRRQQRLLVADLHRERCHTLGRFLAPLAFQAEARVDLHPRFSPDGARVAIDSAHRGARGFYVLDIADALARFAEAP